MADAQGNNYSSKNVDIVNNRYNNKRLGDRTLYSTIVDGKRYFSSLDAEIYFGTDKFIDEIVSIQWSIEQQTLPLFGYNSYTFDDIAVGARQIQGMFMINFTKANFLYSVLSSLTAINRSRLVTENTGSSELLPNSNFERERIPMWDRSFNIVVGYGDYNKKGRDTSMVCLYCVQITGCQQVLGTDGNPIAETYSFIAKDIRYDLNLSEVGNSGSSNKEEEEESKKEVEESTTVFEFDTLYSTGNLSTIKRECSMNIKYSSKNGNIKSISITPKTENGAANLHPVSVRMTLDGKGGASASLTNISGSTLYNYMQGELEHFDSVKTICYLEVTYEKSGSTFTLKRNIEMTFYK